MESTKLEALRLALLEAERQASRDSPRFREPAPGKLAEASSRRNVVVFGRRGSGKTSLLAKASLDLEKTNLIAWIDAEPYKSLTYPDVLLSFLDVMLEGFQRGMTQHPKRPRWFQIAPFSIHKRKWQSALTELENLREFVSEQLEVADGAEVENTRTVRQSSTTQAGTDGSKAGIPVAATYEHASGTEEGERRSAVYDKKGTVDRARRRIHAFIQQLARELGLDTYVFIDDLYHLPRDAQPKVVDFFQGLSKDSRMFVKIGTIRHRTTWYQHGDQPIGAKLGDDAAGIDLDLTLEEFQRARDFLFSIVQDIATEAQVGTIDSVINSGAKDRLTVGSGGVVRDFISLLRRSIEIAQERAIRQNKEVELTAEDVNHASANSEEYKREELRRDAAGEGDAIERAFEQIRQFCIADRKSNIFLMDLREDSEDVALMNELVDLRLVHKVRSSVTTTHKTGQRYTALMIDLSQCVNNERVIKGVELIPFWKGPQELEKLRRVGAVFPPRSGFASQAKKIEPVLTQPANRKLADFTSNEDAAANKA